MNTALRFDSNQDGRLSLAEFNAMLGYVRTVVSALDGNLDTIFLMKYIENLRPCIFFFIGGQRSSVTDEVFCAGY